MIFYLGDHPPFDCRTCKRKDEHNCNNRYKLLDPALLIDEKDPYYRPIWFDVDLKEKFPHKGKYPTTVVKLLNIRLYECPITWMTSYTKRLINLLFLDKEPPKLVDDPWAMQPKWYIEAVNIYKAVKHDIRKANEGTNNG